jgi:sorbitol-specific phosphotransferase system component IIA
VQTIGRFCGFEQWKQALVHFGDDFNKELRDYLVVHKSEAEQRRNICSAMTDFKALNRSLSSLVVIIAFSHPIHG